VQHKGFRYKISIEVMFHPNDLILLFHASARHYDRYCQALGEQDGALRMALVHLEDLEGERVYPDHYLDTEEKILTFLRDNTHLRTRGHFLTFREIDTMAKTMEYYATARKMAGVLEGIGVKVPNSPPQEYIDHINAGLRTAMDAINARHGDVQEAA
jgi:hypothetical protein